MPTPLLSVTQEEAGLMFGTEDPLGRELMDEALEMDIAGGEAGGCSYPQRRAVLQRVGRGVQESATAEV